MARSSCKVELPVGREPQDRMRLLALSLLRRTVVVIIIDVVIIRVVIIIVIVVVVIIGVVIICVVFILITILFISFTSFTAHHTLHLPTRCIPRMHRLKSVYLYLHHLLKCIIYITRSYCASYICITKKEATQPARQVANTPADFAVGSPPNPRLHTVCHTHQERSNAAFRPGSPSSE